MEEPATAEGSLLDILQDPDVLDFGDIDDEVERLMAAELPPLLTFIEPLSSASSSMGVRTPLTSTTQSVSRPSHPRSRQFLTAS